MSLRARKVSGALEKRPPGLSYMLMFKEHTVPDRSRMLFKNLKSKQSIATFTAVISRLGWDGFAIAPSLITQVIMVQL